jgi:hypothetical protein
MSQAEPRGGSGGRWPHRSWQFWCGLLFGAGVGLLLGAALVELELLTLHSKAWVSALGCVVVGAAGCLAGWRGRRGGGSA